MLRVTKQSKLKYITIGNLRATEKQWNEEIGRYKKDKRLCPDNEKYNILLNEIENRANDIILSFERIGKNWTLSQFDELFSNKGAQGNVLKYIDKLVCDFRDTEHYGNANCYENTRKILEIFDSRVEKRLFGEIDVRYLKDFDLFLEKRGCAGNTRRYYIKTLRAIWNRAIKDGIATTNDYPFGANKFEVSKLGEETKKRYLTIDRLEQIKQTSFDDPSLEEARKLFLFLYYCYGISWVDAARLNTTNIVQLNGGRYLVYKREKIKNQKAVREIKIKITSEIDALMEWFRINTKLIDNYLLPIVNQQKLSGESLYKHIRHRFTVNKNKLRTIANDLNINDMRLTSYVARHSMAMVLQANNVPREVISQTLGHNDMETTNIYLDSFTTDVIDEAGKLL